MSTPTAPQSPASAKGKRRPITRAYYDAMVAAFREHGPVWQAIQRETGCAIKTAKRAWEKGWPEKQYPAIKDVIAEEQRAVRERLEEQRRAENAAARPAQPAAMVTQSPEERERARQESITTRAEEAQLVQAARRNAIALQATMRHLLSGGHKLAEKVRETLKTADLKPKEAAKVFQSIASMMRAANDASKVAMEMERKLMGAPESVVGHMLDLDSDEAAAEEIMRAVRALQRAKRRGLVIDVDFADVPPEPSVATGQIVGARVMPASIARSTSVPDLDADDDIEADTGVFEDDVSPAAE